MEQHTYPTDLVQAQIDYHRAYQALAADPYGFHTERRRRLLHLSAQVLFHPYWEKTGGRGRLEGLRRQARTLEPAPTA
ncbi:hypothetical protein AS594_36055 [Streptomyces agglomeratus]|uniref:Uncharacterized protein n=1 Tax=Streptomyces agglomeratus TaxID=285458 RepID=A0A1E5PHP2_9ACTN|nr:hypothetical protein [Streptomyces agglomeratus]OEJ29026.1 hypothetical protein AS594_36055 [Streptomyces agglomeratus]